MPSRLPQAELIVPTPFISDTYRSQLRTTVFYDVGTVWDTTFNDSLYTCGYACDRYYDYSTHQYSHVCRYVITVVVSHGATGVLVCQTG